MRSNYVTYQVAEDSLLEHPAVQAWSKLQVRSVKPEAVIALKEHRYNPWEAKSAVYRLEGVGPGRAAVIAKRCRQCTADLEHTIYEEVLPRLAVTVPAYYGSLEDGKSGYRWLFFEDAQGAAYSPDIQEHRAAAARWLALLHTSGARVPQVNQLPDRGPRYYMGQLESGYECISKAIANPALKPGDVQVLEGVLGDLEFLGLRWPQFEGFCETMPSTLVHCDLAVKNIRTRTSAAGTTILPFDWEFSGWGPPAVDLGTSARPDPAVYWHAVRETWSGLAYAALQQLVRVGTFFRLVACIDWIAGWLATEWVARPMYVIEVYQLELQRSIQLYRSQD